MKRLLPLALLLLSFAARAELEITVTGGETGALPIAIVPFQAPPDVRDDLAAIVEADLERSGFFRPLSRKDMLEKPSDPDKVQFRNWRALDIEHLVVGRLKRTGGRLAAEFYLLDTVRGRTVMGQSVEVPARERMRAVGHRIADLIYEKLTGIPGVFSTEIAYVVAKGGPFNRQHQLLIADADGANEKVVVTSREPLMSPAWSPDGRQLAFVGYERNRSAVYIYTLRSGALRKIVSEPGINGAPAWSPDGRKLAVTMSFESNPDIYVIDIESGKRKRLTDHFAIDTEPAWSPDGNSIAFTSDRGGQPQVYLVPSDGGEARRITYEGSQNLRPSFSPNGRYLTLVNQSDMGYRIGVFDLKTRELRVVTSGPLDESPSFAPNGALIIYAAQGRGAELATVSLDGRVRTRLSQAGDVREPAWSPLPQ